MVSKTFMVKGRIFHWKVLMFENDCFVKATNHVYRFKFLAQADADFFTKMERIREQEARLDWYDW